MVSETHSRLVPASYLDGASCQLPVERADLSAFERPGVRPLHLLSQLTPAERLVAIHAAHGMSNKEICSALGRAEATIKHQISSAMRKLGVQSRCQLIVRLLA
ncbi:MAG: LuxR C-terminal-related transcriptional regulator [Lacunisphaera sp.]|nr:LuxR C-terminal-related transcriptional regulator [Lacunisphaera sp.]